MDDQQIGRTFGTAVGEAMYAAFSQAALWSLLIVKDVISREGAEDTIDRVLLTLENTRQTVNSPAAIDHARSRLEPLLRQV